MAAPAYEILDTPIVVTDMIFWAKMRDIDAAENPMAVVVVCVDILKHRTTLTPEQIGALEPEDFWEIVGKVITWMATKAFLMNLNKTMDKMEGQN